MEGTQMAIRLGENQMESLLNVNILQLTNEAKAPVSGFSQYSQQVTVTTVGSKERQIDVITYWKVKGTEVSFPLTTLVNRY